jgi:predicted permease
LLDAVAARIGALPGVEHVGFIDDMFITGQGNHSVTIPGRGTDSIAAGQLNDGAVSPGFFGALRIPLRSGRLLARTDAETKIRALWSPVNTGESLAEKEAVAIAEPVVVNEAFARRYFPGESPIGKRFCIDPTNKTYWYEIIGVVGDIHRQGLEHESIPEYFGPYVPPANGRLDLVIRVDRNPSAFAPTIRRIVQSGIAGVLIPTVSTADQQLGEFSAQRRLQTWLLASFAGLALALAMIGVYGVLHYAMAERTNEIGIRVALGASPADVVAMALRDGIRLPAVGLVLGAVTALGAARTLDHLLFRTRTADAVTYASVVIILGISALAACYLPARRAASIDPITALRQE